ncbi:hypothetical protein IRY61_00770 [Candidatus Saccharibacteria bacterium]|nr:hypothetical protein [Candidatus Saccharibacteria bacterium]
MRRSLKPYFSLLGAGLALCLAGAGMLAVEWLQIPGIVLLVAGIVLLVAAQVYWWIFG